MRSRPPGRSDARRAAWLAARGWLLTALAAAMLMWTALLDGRPAVFSDTALYYGQAEYLFQALGVVGPGQTSTPPHDPTDLPDRPGSPSMPAAIDGGRSPIYGAAIYALQRLGGLWLVAFAQAWAAASVIYLLYRAWAPAASGWGYLWLMAGLAALTPLPFFASWIMPDVFAGVAMCGLLVLLVYPDRLGRAERAGALALAGFGLAAHRSNLLDAAGLTLVAAALLRLAGLPWTKLGWRLAPIAGLGLAVLAASALAYVPIRARAGEPIGSPPFLSARVIGDGPGRRYLRRVCTGPQTPFALCAFRDRPLATSDQILWSHLRRSAVFVAASPAVRQRLEREDARFALDETLAQPVAQALASGWAALQQFALIYVDDPLKNQGVYVADGFWRRTSLPRILPDARACAGPGGCPTKIGEPTSWVLEGVGLVSSLAWLGWRLSAADLRAVLSGREKARWDDDRVRLLTMLALVAAVLVVNAAACGALSGPFPRYQARLIWLAPLAAALLGAYPASGRKGQLSRLCNTLATRAARLDAPVGRL